MVNYNNGKIYKIELDGCKEIYVGSTTRLLCHRIGQHRAEAKTKPKPVHKYINDYGWDKAHIVLIEDYPCERREQLEARERYWIEKLGPTLNIRIPTRTYNEWCDANREAIAARKKEYREANREAETARKKEYYEANREAIAARYKKWSGANRESIAARQKEYREANREAIAAREKKWREANHEAVLAQQKEYRAKKKASKQMVTPDVISLQGQDD